MMHLAAAALLGCADSTSQALAPPHPDASGAGGLQECAEQAYEEMRVLCHIELAAQASARGDAALADQACERIPLGTWSYECHFRAGEELGRAGLAEPAVGHCAQAERFTRFCLTHAAWATPWVPELSAKLPPDELIPRLDARVVALAQAVESLEPALRPEALDSFRMAWWFNAYYGSGAAHPAAALAASPDQRPQARSAYFLEAARLRWAPGEVPVHGAVQALLEGWSPDAQPLEGEALPPDQRHGRYIPPMPAPCEQALQPVPLYGGGRRLLGESPEEDRTIAALEALFFRTDTTTEHFLPWLEDPRERVRWTAARLLRHAEPAGQEIRAILEPLRGHEDRCVAWHARDALAALGRGEQPGGPR
jgi:hypothetical protein